MVATGYQLFEHEAFVIIPMLCEKSGAYSQAVIKEKCKLLVKQCFEVCDPKKTFALMSKFGLASQNKKSVAETLDELTKYVTANGTELLNEAFYKQLIVLADSPDRGVREGSLAVFSEDYKMIGDGVWQKIGSKVSEKAKGLFEQRVKALGGVAPSGVSPNKLNASSNNKLSASMNKGNLNASVGGGPKKPATELGGVGTNRGTVPRKASAIT